MSGGNALAVTLSLSAGVAGSVQAAVMGALGQRIGTIEALGFSTVVAAVAGVALLLVATRSLAAFPDAVAQPPWLLTGGVLSAFIVLGMTVAVPRIGVAAAIGLVIAGQLAMAALIDRYGLLGVEQIGISWPRVLGIVLLALGAALSLRR